MKLEIKIRCIGTDYLPTIVENGEWIDLASRVDIHYQRATSSENLIKIPLGVAMQLPQGYEAVLLPRSSTPLKKGILLSNSQGVIDNSYSGNDDEWVFVAVPLNDEVHIAKNDRIAQFRIQLSQKATFWQKLKWLFCSGVKITRVERLNSPNRGGFGTSGQ